MSTTGLTTVSADSTGAYVIPVKPYSIVTGTTLENLENTEFYEPLPVEGVRAVLDTNATGATPDASDSVLYAEDRSSTRAETPT
jgi:hypothetical protein